jgi:hypothetical protein
MNRLEALYAAELEKRRTLGEVSWYSFEAITLKLADRCRYTPDFAVMLANGDLEMHECKGFMRDDARVKLRTAAEKFPLRFLLVRIVAKKHGGGGFLIEEI